MKRLAVAAALLSAPAPASVGAEDVPVLTVIADSYFTSSDGPAAAIETAFEAGCACDLEIVSLDVGAVPAVSKNGFGADADVVVGFPALTSAMAQETGLFAPHGLDLRDIGIPGGWSDSVFLPYEWTYLAFIYDSEALPAPPASFRALVEDSDVEILIPHPLTGIPGLTLLLWVKAIYGDGADAAWVQLAPRIADLQTDWIGAYDLFKDGEAPMALGFTTAPAHHLLDGETDRYRVAVFEDGHYLRINAAAILAASDQPDLAARFLAFLIGNEAQGVLSVTDGMYPVTMPEEGTPTFFDAIVPPEAALRLPPEEVADNLPKWIADWRAAVAPSR